MSVLARKLLVGVKKRSWLLLGVLLVFVANFQLLGTRKMVHWDAYDEMWPYFRWTGSVIRAGYFPDFFPNIVMGYPIGANIQAGTYNLFYALVATLFPDSLLSINLIYIAHQLVFFLLAFSLARSYGFMAVSALFFGLSLIGSGFFIGHAEHFSYLATATGLMGGLLGIRYSVSDRPGSGASLAGLSTYHMLTAGYPANILFGALCLIVYWVWLWFCRSTTRPQLLAVAAGFGMGGLLGLPALLHFFHQLGQSSRGEGLDVALAMSGSLPPYALLNLFHPLWRMGYSEPSMERFHLLNLGMLFVLLGAIFRRRDEINRFPYFLWLGLAFLMMLFALGKFSPIPIRVWMAEHFFVFRAGRFPSGEHRGLALFFLALAGAVGFEWMWGAVRSSLGRKALMAMVALDFMVVMYGTRYMRYEATPPEDRGSQARYQVVFEGQDQWLIDAPRLCPADGARWETTAILTERHLAPNEFYWSGYTNLKDKLVESGREVNRDFVCGPSRLWFPETKTPAPYSLALYSPGRIRFVLKGAPESGKRTYLWADYNDGYWLLRINGQVAPWLPAPMRLRTFEARPGDSIEMVYEGPLSRLWR